MTNEKSFFFVKSFDKKLAESFVNNNLLTNVERSIKGTAQFLRISHVLRTDHSYDDEVHHYESLTLKFGYSTQRHEYIFGEWRPVKENNIWGVTEEQELDLLLLCEVPYENDENDPDQNRFIDTWTVERTEITDLHSKVDSPELLIEIKNFIEIGEVNAYWRQEKKYFDEMKRHYKFIENYYATMHDHITEEPSTDHFCERCQESPCACSDADPG